MSISFNVGSRMTTRRAYEVVKPFIACAFIEEEVAGTSLTMSKGLHLWADLGVEGSEIVFMLEAHREFVVERAVFESCTRPRQGSHKRP